MDLLSRFRALAQVWLLLVVLGTTGALATGNHDAHHNETSVNDPPPTTEEACAGHVVVYDTTTVYSETTVHNTSTLWAQTTIPVTHYVDVIVYKNETVSSVISQSTTTTYHYSESTTTTFHFSVSTTETETDSTTITQTATQTTTTTQTSTIFSYSYNPCPTSCSISAATVNLFFWPTDRPYTYPSTYFDPIFQYTFTSPSVYMYIPTAVGTNPAGATVGPATSAWMLPLRLPQVSTINGTVTRQLTLADLGTDCPKTADPTAIATLVDSRCDPILAAPEQVSSWAWPCNACGRFGLFDPPYAIPTVTGGILTTTVTPVTTSPVGTGMVIVTPTATATATASPVSQTGTTPAVGVVGTLLVVYESNGTPLATATIQTPGVSGTVSSTVSVSGTPGCDPASSSGSGTTSSTRPANSTVSTAAAEKLNSGSGLGWALCVIVAVAFVI